MKKLILILIILFFACTTYCQKRNITINIGTGFSKPDLQYDFLVNQVGPDAINIAKINDYAADFDYFINASKNIYLFKKTFLNIGLGYAFLKSKPRLPVENMYFNLGVKIFITSRTYYNHKIQVPMGLQHIIIDRENLKFGAYFNNLVNISLLKQINKSSNKLSLSNNLEKREFEPHSVETFGGLLLQTKRIQYALDYRFFNGKFKDDAFLNNGLTFDTFNPLKFRFSIGYKF